MDAPAIRATLNPAFLRVYHRPWPLPPGRWTWRQTWCDLLFAHWPVDAAALRPHIPAGLEIEEFDGTAWLGVVPFRMEGVMRRPLPDLPGISAFPELNVRTYVRREEKSGVWFFSLDATNPLAVWAARRWFHLPYHNAKMSSRATDDGGIEYASIRKGAGAEGRFRAMYAPKGPVRESRSGTLDQFLTERYCLFAAGLEGTISRTEVHHAPWPLQEAVASIEENTMALPLGIPLDSPPATLHFARRLEVVVWNPVNGPR